MTDLSFKQSRAEDRACISALAHRYAHNGRDNLVIEDQYPLFTEDAVILLPDGTEVPILRITDVLRGEEAQYIRHHVTTHDIVWVDDDNATGEVQFFANTNESAMDHWGCWRDKYVKQDDGSWLIKERAIVVDGANPDGWFARMYFNQD